MTEDCDVCGIEFEYDVVLCEMCESRLCGDCVAVHYNELVGLCVDCLRMINARPSRDCCAFDLEAECPVELCPKKAVCRRIRQEAGSTAVEAAESRADDTKEAQGE